MDRDREVVVHVAVGVVTGDDGRVLVTQRRADAHQGGLWEFPGGKVEPDETVPQALARELNEELGIRVEAAEPLLQVPHDYGDKRVYLDVYHVSRFRGQPSGLEGQPLRWVEPRALHTIAFPAANRPISAALALPRTCLITPEVADDVAFLDGIEAALSAGARFVQFRRRDLERPRHDRLAAAVAARCQRAGALFAVNDEPHVAVDLNADVCHLSSQRLQAVGHRPVPEHLWLGASCHDRDEIDRALALGVDYLFLSPVRPTGSHPGAVALGWDRFQRMLQDVPMPVYALGGLGRADLTRARAHGAHGIAAITGLWPVDGVR